jgi:hypothetical protein
MRPIAATRLACAASLSLLLLPPAAIAQTNVPQPFPRPAPSQPSKPAPPPMPPAGTPDAPQQLPAPTADDLGVPLYPGSEFIASYDAGRGQRFYIFGSTASFVYLVQYYRTTLKQRGDQVFEVPATHQFDIGRFNDDTMAFPPSVTIKDFESEISKGYPNPKRGGEPERFPTIIQIVPAVPER